MRSRNSARQFLDERAGLTGARAAEFHPVAAMAQRERLPRAGDADVEQAALFVDRAFGFRAVVRQDAFLQADEIDMVELEAFGRVHRDQGHAAFRFDVVLFVLLAFLVEHDFVEKTAQALGGATR